MPDTNKFGEDWTLEMMAFDKGTLVAMLKESLLKNNKMLDAMNFVLANPFDVHLIEEKLKEAIIYNAKS